MSTSSTSTTSTPREQSATREVVDPVHTGTPYVPGVWDVKSDRPSVAPRQTVSIGVVVVEGIFLHRDELAGTWDASVFVDVPFDVTAARMAIRDGTSTDRTDPHLHRYVDGQHRYFAECDPRSRATIVLDNTDLAAPRLIH